MIFFLAARAPVVSGSGSRSWCGWLQCRKFRFKNLEGIAGRILGYFSQSLTFFVREIQYLMGLLQTPAVTTYTVDVGTAGVCNNPVLNIMVYPKHRWYEQIMIPEFSGMKFFEPEISSQKI